MSSTVHGMPQHYDPLITTRVDEEGREWIKTERSHMNLSDMEQMGVFGNIWVYSHHLNKAGDYNPGHKHNHDHVTLLATGSVRCEVVDDDEGTTIKDFKAPTFIVIDKNKTHKFTALEDNTVFYCVFALRDEDGDVTDFYSGDNSPYSARKD